MKLRSIELVVPEPQAAAEFMTGTWGMAPASTSGSTQYLRGSGTFPYLVSFAQGAEPFVRTTTFVCTRTELGALERRVAGSGLTWTATTSSDPGGGDGLIVELPEGELFRFLADATGVQPIAGRDLPVQLTHV